MPFPVLNWVPLDPVSQLHLGEQHAQLVCVEILAEDAVGTTAVGVCEGGRVEPNGVVLKDAEDGGCLSDVV